MNQPPASQETLTQIAPDGLAAGIALNRDKATPLKVMRPSWMRIEWLSRRSFPVASTAPMPIGETAQHIDNF
jgi:hypothetical protein